MKAVPEGFRPAFDGPFEHALEGRIGPIYFRELEPGYELGMWIEREHCNIRLVTHGGFMTAMSDIACGFTARHHYYSDDTPFVSVSLSHQFVAAVPLGAWLTSASTIRKAGRSTLFLDCEHHVDGELVGLSHVVMKKVGRAP